MIARPRSAPAFTLIELLVVVALIALLISILLPALAGARTSARMAKGSGNLSQLGKMFSTHAVDLKGAYSTGAWDFRRDYALGPMLSTIDTDPVAGLRAGGWVSDFVERGYGKPGELLSPGTPAQTSRSVSRIVTEGYEWPLPPGLSREQFVQKLINEGYNTNYCQSWYMAHTETRSRTIDTSLNTKRYRYTLVNGSARLAADSPTLGPLREQDIVQAKTSAVPMIGDGNIMTEGPTAETVVVGSASYLPARSLSDGPVTAPPGLAGTITWNRQNYTDFGPVYGQAGINLAGQPTRQQGQMVFADGNVQTFTDTSRTGTFRNSTANVTFGNIQAIKYDDLEGRVFGGTLKRVGINF